MARFISPLPYPGGKAKKWNLIKSYFPENTHYMNYYEPFLGGSSIGFNALKEKMFNTYFFSDIDPNIIGIFKLLNTFEYWELNDIGIEKYFYPNIKFDNLGDELEKMPFWLAALCRYNVNFNSLYHTKPTKLKLEQNWNQSKCKRIKKFVSLMLCSKIVFKNRNYLDTPMWVDDMFFYLDPPYYGVKNLYRHGNDFDFDKFFDWVKSIDKAEKLFVLSINDHLVVREKLKQFNIHEHEWFYSSSNSKRKDCKVGKELIITNFIRGRDEYE